MAMDFHNTKVLSVPLDSIDDSRRLFRTSMCRDEKPLIRSIETAGILCPVIVRTLGNSDRRELVHGHRRVAAARELGLASIPAAELTGEEADDSRAFDLAFWDNCVTRGFNLAEASMAVRSLILIRGKDDQSIIKTYLPAMGFQPSKKVLDNLAALIELSPGWLEYFIERGVSLKVAGQILKLPEDDAGALFMLVQSIRPNQNHLRELVLLLAEVAAREKLSTRGLIETKEISDLVDPSWADARARHDAVMSHLRKRRNPELARFDTGARELADRSGLPSSVSMNTPALTDKPVLRFSLELASTSDAASAAKALSDEDFLARLQEFLDEWS